ncbi:2-amino-4-hydroxy-6-hydroxymethyldihydropteridine diphosphokinase [Sphingobacterium sp. MYb382]|uniref:2-amino-4-hydroxy-6- hydroxymethyldihydropteridine diphosphokinase n=1 Tax=Sphingobacterium sp. MYb382 TaxID=2745278 RepID=UPI0030B025A7
MNTVFLLLGANLGDPVQQLAKAVRHIEEQVGAILSISQVYQSEAWGVTDQPAFLNQALAVATALSPLETLEATQNIENKLGRVRLTKWGARLIDIDILYYNDVVYEDERLSIPHPLLQDRKFVLLPLNEIAAEYIHPKLKKTNQQLFLSCIDPLQVTIHPA